MSPSPDGNPVEMEGGHPRLEVLKKFAATQMLAIHASRKRKRQRIDKLTQERTTSNVEDLIKHHREGMVNRRQAFTKCLNTCGSTAITFIASPEVSRALLIPQSTPVFEDEVISDEEEDEAIDLTTDTILDLSTTITFIDVSSIPDKLFHNLFRMSRSTFSEIIDLLSPHMEESIVILSSNFAIALWVLGGYESGNSSLCNLAYTLKIQSVMDFCRAVTKFLMASYISLTDASHSSKWNFQCKFGLRNCIGALNSTHIAVKLDETTGANGDYLNSQGLASIIMQAVVSSDYKFCDLSIGYPGMTPVDNVLHNSALWRKAESGELFAPDPDAVGQPAPHDYLIAGTCYPLTDFIVTPYTGISFSDTEKKFNSTIYNALSVTQRAFKMLRVRFPLINSLSTDFSVEDVPTIVAACCVLHNICEIKMDSILSHWERKTNSMNTFQSHETAKSALGNFEPTQEALEFRDLVKGTMISMYERAR